MVKCSNCGAEVPVDATFCESCGVKITTAAAPPPPPSAYPTPPPAAAPPAEKAGPPMKLIAVAVVVIVIVLGGVFFLGSSATSQLKLSIQGGTAQAAMDWDFTINLQIDNPSMFEVEITGNYLEVKLRSSGSTVTAFTGYAHQLVMRVPSDGTTVQWTFSVTAARVLRDDPAMWNVFANAYWRGFPLEISISGKLDTKCLFATGTSTISSGWTSITY